MIGVNGVNRVTLLTCQRDRCHARMTIPTTNFLDAGAAATTAGWTLTPTGVVCPGCSTGGLPVSPEFCTTCNGTVRYSPANEADVCGNCGTTQPNLTPEGERW